MDRIQHKNCIEFTPHRLAWHHKGQCSLVIRCLKVTTSREEAHQVLYNMMLRLSSTPENIVITLLQIGNLFLLKEGAQSLIDLLSS